MDLADATAAAVFKLITQKKTISAVFLTGDFLISVA